MALIKLPEKFYVGVREQSKDEETLPLAFATPFGTDKAFEKRKSTVDSWTRGYNYLGKNPKVIDTRILDNVLLEGYRISKSVKRTGWNGGNVVWRIEDPRGFELEISSGNFARILDCTTIVNGVIGGKCIWGRDGATNILIPEASEPYQEALNFTALSKKVVEVGDLKPGMFVRMKDDTIAVYLGLYYGYGVEVDSKRVADRNWRPGNNYPTLTYSRIHTTFKPKQLTKRHVFLQEASALELIKANGNYDAVSGFFGQSGVDKIAEVLASRTMEIDVSKVCATIAKMRRGVFAGYTPPSLVSATPIKKPVFSMRSGLTAGSLAVYETPAGPVFVSDNDFHLRPYDAYYGKADTARFIEHVSFDVKMLKNNQPYVTDYGTYVNGATTAYTLNWQPFTVLVEAEGIAAQPVMTTHGGRHIKDRPLTEQSYKVVPYGSPERDLL